jgi:hypothetical protein
MNWHPGWAARLERGRKGFQCGRFPLTDFPRPISLGLLSVLLSAVLSVFASGPEVDLNTQVRRSHISCARRNRVSVWRVRLCRYIVRRAQSLVPRGTFNLGQRQFIGGMR